MRKVLGTSAARKGFSLAEIITSLTIGSMVLVAVLIVYNRAERSAAAVTRKLNVSRLPTEVMQRIAEDLDGIIASGSDTKINIENKFENGFPTARLTITKTFFDSKNQEQTYEEIIWQTSYDFASNIDGLVLYRSHSGVAAEDKLLDGNKDVWERGLFVPICAGITFFRIRVPWGETYLDKWSSTSLPPGIEVTISFAEPFKTVAGTLDVAEAEKIVRTIAVDRTRKMKFTVETPDLTGPEEETEEKEKQQTDKTEPENEKKQPGSQQKTRPVRR
jgi:prepilin-type N-terminal cleavage/methylation domain-containing protein